jgi:hypothetical protein
MLMGIVSFLPNSWAQVVMIVITACIAAACVRRFVQSHRAGDRGVDQWIVLAVGILLLLVALTSNYGDPSPPQPDVPTRDVESPR